MNVEIAAPPRRTFVMKQPRKDELRRQLEVKDAEIAWQQAARESERRTAGVALAFMLLLFAGDFAYHWLVVGSLP